MSRLWMIERVVKVISSVVIAAVAVCFSVGLLIVNLRLARHGVFGAGFVKTEYVLAGALFFFLSAFVYCAMLIVENKLKTARSNLQGKRRVKAILYLVLACIVALSFPVIVITAFCNYELTLLSWRAWVVLAILLPVPLHVSNLFVPVSKFWSQLTSNTSRELPTMDWRSHIHEALYPIFYFITVISLYATYAYPYLSPAFGGGKKDAAIVYVERATVPLLRTLQMPIAQDSLAIGPLIILSESETELILLPSDDGKKKAGIRAIRFRKDLAEAVVYVDPKRFKEH